MKSTKTQNYDIGKRANKENDSVNGKCNTLTKPLGANGTSSFDWAKNEAINDQRKLRLSQVREQSKEIATQIRDNVRREEQRQLSVVNDIRKNEFLDWRQKQLERIDGDYNHCLTHFGEAHIAAQKENEKQRIISEQKEKNRKIALRRGREAAERLKNMGKPANIRPICKKTVTIVEKNAGKTPATPISDTSTSTSSSLSSSTSSESSICSVIDKNRLKSVNLKHLSLTPKKSALKTSRSTGSSPVKKPTKYVSINGSAVIDLTLSDSHLSDASPVPITKVSDLIKGSDIPYAPTPKSPSKPLVSRTYKLSNGQDVATKRTKSVLSQPITTTPTLPYSTKTSSINKTSTKASTKQFVPEFVKTKPGSIAPLKKIPLTSTLPQKVQFYDHANRFSKEYDRNIDVVDEVHEINNAWDEAAKENQRQFCNRIGSRKLEEDRAKVALEKEKIRKDYDLMNSQLSDILKDEKLTKSFLETNEMLSESRLRQLVEEKQQLMENNFKSIFRPPVPITCPKVGKKAAGRNRELNVAQQPKKSEPSNNHDTSHSFLLDYVMARTNNICDDIDRCRIESDQIPNESRIKALHRLLNKVNSLRRILCEEIKGDIDASKVIDEVEAVAREQHKIMDDTLQAKTSKATREHDLEEREQMLKEKESCIDKKVYELYVREKKMKEQNKKLSDEEQIGVVKRTKIVTANGTETLTDEIPVKIVINLNKKENSSNANRPKDPIKWSDRLKRSSESKETTEAVTNVEKVRQIEKMPVKSKAVAYERRQYDEISQATSITAYLSPPEHMKTQLTKVLQKNNVSIDRGSHQNGLDNDLAQYIIRLLGMSRTSIEQLNMSSVSTVKTPNSSVINISNNQQFISSTSSTPLSMSSLSFDNQQTMDQNKMQQLAQFLAQYQSTPPNRDNRDNREIDVGTWNNILSRKSDHTKSKSEQSDKLKSISSGPHKIAAQQPHQSDLISKYDELTANCTKRIIDLDSMISKVREEKQKILENTLSSGGSLITATKENHTEYFDFGGQQQKTDIEGSPTLPLSDSKSTNAPSSDFDTTPNEQRHNLLSTRLNGSKDSGVGNSRPVTSSDYRDSPDLRINHKGSETDGKVKGLADALRDSKEKAAFEPMLKDIPKITYRVGSENGVAQGFVPVESSSQAPMNGKDKNGKHPPIALARYSPHLEDDGPHELSTITEVDTPATSRLNATDLTCAGNDIRNTSATKKITENEIMTFLYSHFPNFKDYVKSNESASLLSTATVDENFDITQRASIILGEKLEKILGGNDTDMLEYRAYNNENPAKSNEKAVNNQNMSYSKFPTHSEYMQSDHMVDTNPIDPLQLSDLSEPTDSTLPDIVSELKSRNIFVGPLRDRTALFEQLDGTEFIKFIQNAATDSLSESLENDLKKMGLNWVTTMMKKTKTAAQLSTSSESSDQNEKQRSPPKLRPQLSNGHENGGHVEKCDSNSFIDRNIAISIKPTESSRTTEQTEPDVHCKPTNLKDFLARELLKHSSTSSMSSDSSLGSIFLKSFLGRSVSLSDDQQSTPQQREKDKHRTSTPVQHVSGNGRSISSSNSRSDVACKSGEQRDDAGNSHDLTPKFFSGESNLSSVGLSSIDSAGTTSSDEQNKIVLK